MILPKKWGQGQIFAFSALDGPSYASDDFVGTLSGDRIGIRFHSNTKRELAFVNVKDHGTKFDAVTSDYICFRTLPHKKNRILYADRHLVIGDAQGSAYPVVLQRAAAARRRWGKSKFKIRRTATSLPSDGKTAVLPLRSAIPGKRCWSWSSEVCPWTSMQRKRASSSFTAAFP